MAQLLQTMERVSGVKAPTRAVPAPVLFAVALLSEAQARLTGRPALVTRETARLIVAERDRTHFDSSKTERELGVAFRPLEETLRDTIVWYGDHGWLEPRGAGQLVGVPG
jgi:dihydroflavonol-4-reductase